MLDKSVEQVMRTYLPQADDLTEIADLFSVYSDTTRLKLISALAISELCVNDIAEVLSMQQSTVSHQLKLLRDKKIVSNKRRGKTIFYYLSSDDPCQLLDACVNHLSKR